MQPKYNLPDIDAARNINLETKPKQVAAWLKRVPLSNPVEAAEEMADYLTAANRAKIAHDHRAKVAELLAPAVDETVNALRQQYVAAALPLPPRLRRNRQLAHRLLMEMAALYKLLISEWLGKTFKLGRTPLPGYMLQLLLNLQTVLEISFETYENVPPGVWVDAHQTYNHALRNGMQDVIPEGSPRAMSLEQVYKTILLTALADPYHFPHIELPWAKDIIARFSNLALLFPAEDQKGKSGLFIVEVNTDSPPRPLVWDSHPTNPRWDLMLNTTEMVKHLAMLSTHVKGREDPEKLGLPTAARDPAYAGMLRRLKLNWGATSQRQSQRRKMQSGGKTMEVALGLRTIHQHLLPNAAARSAMTQGQQEAAQTSPIFQCETVNDSMGGLALRKIDAHALQIKVGELASVRQGNGNWSVGLVRWFRLPEGKDLFFGVQLLAPKCIAVQVGRQGASKPWPGLLVQASSALKQSAMLITSPGSVQPEQTLTLRSVDGTMTVRTDKQLEYTPSVEIYRISLA